MSAALDVEVIRRDFPILKTKMNGKPLVYLDSAATSQKPTQVLDAISDYYRTYNANIHRGLYRISEQATEKYIESKEKLAVHIGAQKSSEIVYVRNATEAINLVSKAWGEKNVKKGDHILISEMEHHANLVPWQVLAKRNGAILDYIKMDKQARHLDMDSFEEKLEMGPKIVAVTEVSNVLGTINDVKTMAKKAHRKGAVVLVDGAQSAPHMKVNVSDIDCDFFALSGHKMLAPTGIGALYGRTKILEEMEPFMAGGDMIKSVTYEGATWNELPWKFEAGTPNIEGGIAFSAAIDYLNGLGMAKVREHEKQITKYALEALQKVKGVTIYGPEEKDMERRGGVVSFALEGIHPHDVAQIFDSEGIAIRAGHHCAMPLVTQRLGQPAVSRLSFYIYNSEGEVDKAVSAIGKVKKLFNR
jgi:cysteine desulfurase/selenocysteine lyase